MTRWEIDESEDTWNLGPQDIIAVGFSLGEAYGDETTGGADADSFVFMKGHGRDRITDFAIGGDRIHLQFDDVLANLAQHGDDVWLKIGNDKLVSENVVREELTEHDFVTEIN